MLYYIMFTLAQAMIISCVRYSSDLSQNILNMSYGINFKYNGMLHHNIDRVWVITKFKMIKPADLKLPIMQLSNDCDRFTKLTQSGKITLESKEISFLCKVVTPLVLTLKGKEQYYKKRALDILHRDVHIALHGHKTRLRRSFGAPTNISHPSGGSVRNKRFITAFLPAIAGLATIAVESLGSFLTKKRNTAMEKGIHAIHTDPTLLNNVLKGLDRDMLLYGKFSLDSLDNIADQLAELHAKSSNMENILNIYNATKFQIQFLGESLSGRIRFSHMVNTYLHTVSEKHIRLYEEFINHLQDLLRAIRTLSRGYLPAELFPPGLLHSITTQAVQMLQENHPDYTAVLSHVTKYYDLKVVTFALDKNDNLIVSFPIFVHDRTKRPLTLYELETVLVPIMDENNKADSYTRVQVSKPYIAINKGYYIELRIPELRMCKKVQSSYLCEELFLVKHQSTHSCISAIYYNSSAEILYKYCNFDYFYNTTATPSVLDGGAKILLANMLTTKKLVCASDNEMAKPIPSYNYVLVNRNILCNCHLDAEYMYLLRSISSCQIKSDYNMEFSLNFAFLDLLSDMWKANLSGLPHSLTTDELAMPIYLDNNRLYLPSLSGEGLHTTILRTPKTLRELRTAIAQQRLMQKSPQFFLSNEQHSYKYEKSPKNMSIFTSYISHIFYMVTSAVSTAVTVVIIYILFKHKKLHAIVSSILLYRASSLQGLVIPTEMPTHKMCQNPWLSLTASIVTILGIGVCAYKYIKPLTCIKGFKYARTCTIYMFVSHKCRYVPLKIKTSTGLLFNFSILGKLEPKDIKLHYNFLWDTLHINWAPVKIKYSGKPMEVIQGIPIPLMDKFRIRTIMAKHPLNIYFMIKQGNSWYALKDNKPNTVATIDPEVPEVESQIIDS